MTYRNSLLSLYPPTPTPNTTKTPNSDQDADFTSQFEEELPASAPVFEGHLYLRTDKKQWQWRLFRFDGTCFTCLSTRKVNLPPNTHVDAPLSNDQPLLHSLPSFTTTSLTSPLLATPTNKSRQKSATSATLPLAKYYQLPKWTVDIANISAVSVLKPSSNKKKLAMLSSSSQKQSRCFCVRTFDGNCFIMKAQKQKDLERWLFVLTKMWKFAQAMKHQLMPQQPQHQQIVRQQQQTQVGNHTPSLYYTSLASTPRHRFQPQDSIPLSHLYQRPHHTSLTCPHLPLNTGNGIDPSMSMVKPQVTSSASQAPPQASVAEHIPSTANRHSDYEKRYQHPALSVEKMECIDAWRQSLGELMASDPQLGVTTPPPIEALPDDDKVSVISDMTSISHRQKSSNHLRRRTSVSSSTASKRSSSRSSNRLKTQQAALPSSLKKKRSNDVKNWIEPRKTETCSTNVNPLVLPSPSPSPIRPTTKTTTPHLPPIDTYHVSYFQDCKTTARSTSSASLDLENNEDEGDQNKRNTTMLDRHAKYHSSTRAKQIQVVGGPSYPVSPPLRQSLDKTTPLSSPSTSPSSLPSRRRQSYPATKNHSSSTDQHSPPARRQHLVSDSSSTNHQRHHHHPPSLLADSPLHSLAHVDNRKSQDEEEISLADLQRSLKRASLQHQQHHDQMAMSQTVSPPSSPPVVVPLRHQSHSYAQQSHTYQPPYSLPHQLYLQHHPYHSSSSVSVTAPAIPPVPYTMNNMNNIPLLSPGGGFDKDMTTEDIYRQQTRVWKKQMEQQQQQQHHQRPTSLEQNKVMQQRRSIQLDSVQW